MAPSTPINMVFYGDSLTLGVPVYENAPQLTYPAVTQTLVPNSTQTTLGWAGQTTVDLLTHYQDALSKFQPGQFNVMVLWCGTNDLAVGNPDPSAVFSNLLTMASTAKNAGWIVVVLAAIPRANYFSDDAHKNNFEANRRNLDLMISTSNAFDAVVTPAALLINPLDYDMFWDQTHLQAAGYNFVAQLVKAAINKCLAPHFVR